MFFSSSSFRHGYARSTVLSPLLVLALLLVLAILSTAGPSLAQTETTDETGVGKELANPSEALPLLQQQNWSAAKELLDAWLAEHPDDLRAWRYLGFARHGLEEYQAAYEAHAKSFDDPTAGAQSRYQAARALARLGKTDEALAFLVEVRKSRRVDLSQAASLPDFESLKDDPRFLELGPSKEEFDQPFVERARVIHEWRGEASGDAFGWIARDLGDVDGDGVHDMVTSAPNKTLPEGDEGGGNAGRVYAYSGKSGKLLWSRDGQAGFLLGRGVERAGDVNADGTPDAVASAPGGDKVFVYGGKDGKILLEIQASQEGEQIGQHVMGVGDANGDGHSDLWVGAPAHDLGEGEEKLEDVGRAALYSGKDGKILFEVFGETPGQRMGETVAGAVLEKSGPKGQKPEPILMVGSPGAGRVHVYRSLDPEAAPRILHAEISGQSFGGMFMSVVGDIDADGKVDLYVSDWQDGARGPSTGRTYVFSGADDRRLLTLSGEESGDGFGIGPAQAGDVNGDGHDDLVIGAWQQASAAAAGGKVYLISGRDGSTLRTLTSRVMGETFGFDAQGLGDVDGDGKIDLLLTSAWSPLKGARTGRVFVVAGE